MKITVKSERTDLTYHAKYKEVPLDLAKEENRFPLIAQLLKAFEIRLSDLKFDDKALSENWIHFSKLHEGSFLDVSLGLEEFTARLNNPKDEKMVTDLYGKLFESIKQIELDVQRIAVQRHFSTTANAKLFLRDLNPNYPVAFEEILEGNGVFYTLKSEPFKMISHITLVNSLVVTGGLFLSVENIFWPNQYDFENAFSIAKKLHDFVVDQLNLVIAQA